MENDKRRERLRFRSWHRGTREIDLILGSFADRYVHAFTPEQISRYEALLEESDPDIYDWVTGKEMPPPLHENDVMHLLRQHRYTDTKAG